MDEGPTKNSEPVFIQMPCIALVHSCVCLGCACVWASGWMGGWGGGGGGVWVRVTLGHLAGPVICKSHEL